MVGLPAILSILLSCLHKKNEIKLSYNEELYELKKYRIVIDVFFFLWLIILLLRSELIGADLPVYKYHFNNFSAFSWNEVLNNLSAGDREPAYYIICKVISFFTKKFRAIMVITALIAIIPIWKLYRENGKSAFLIIVLFLNIAPFSMYFSGLRQVMAMAFVVPCYYCCKSKKIIKFIVTVFIAYFFHKSSFILLAMYPIYHIKWRKKIHLLYLIPIVGLVYIFSTSIFMNLLLLMNDKYIDRYADGIKATGAYAVLLLLFMLMIYCFFIVDETKLDSDTIGLRNLLVFAVFLQIFSGVHTIAMRMNYYFLLFIPLLIDRVIQAGNEKEQKLLQLSKICMVVFFTVYYFIKAYTDADILNVYPYKPFWGDM